MGNVVGNALATNDGGATVEVFAFAAIAADTAYPSPPPKARLSEVDSSVAEDDGADIYAIAASLASAIDGAIAAERWTLAERLQATLDKLSAKLLPITAGPAKAKPRRPA